MRSRRLPPQGGACPRSSRSPRALLLCGVAALVLVPMAAAQQPPSKPAVPPGRDPGGVAIALFGTGLDYTLPEVARRLARDGEGELIGWDLKDNDNRPFRAAGGASAPAEWGGEGTALALAIGTPGRRLVPVKIDPADPQSLARAAAFVAQTPVRLVVVPMWSRQQKDWEAFRQAAARFKDLLFIATAGDDGRDIDREPVWPAAFALANVLVVSAAAAGPTFASPAPNTGARTVDAVVSLTRLGAAGERGKVARTSLAAVVAADAVAGCWPGLVEAYRGEALKRAILAQAAKPVAGFAHPVLEPCQAKPPAASQR